MKKALKKKIIEPGNSTSFPQKSEIIFRLKRPNDKQTLDFICKKIIIYLKSKKKILDLEDQKSTDPSYLKKSKQNPQNEHNLYQQFNNLSLNPSTTTSKNLFANNFRLKRVEPSYIRKKQEELMEKAGAEYRFEKFQKNRIIPENLEKNEEKKEILAPGMQNLSKIIEKYKKLEEEELKSQEKKEKNTNEADKKVIIYDLNYKRNQNTIMINEMPAELKLKS